MATASLPSALAFGALPRGFSGPVARGVPCWLRAGPSERRKPPATPPRMGKVGFHREILGLPVAAHSHPHAGAGPRCLACRRNNHKSLHDWKHLARAALACLFLLPSQMSVRCQCSHAQAPVTSLSVHWEVPISTSSWQVGIYVFGVGVAALEADTFV